MIAERLKLPKDVAAAGCESVADPRRDLPATRNLILKVSGTS